MNSVSWLIVVSTILSGCISDRALVKPVPLDNPHQQDHRQTPIGNNFKYAGDLSNLPFGIFKTGESCKSIGDKLYLNLDCTYEYSFKTEIVCDRTREVIVERPQRNKEIKIFYVGKAPLKDPKRFPTTLMTDNQGVIQFGFEVQGNEEIGFEEMGFEGEVNGKRIPLKAKTLLDGC